MPIVKSLFPKSFVSNFFQSTQKHKTGVFIFNRFEKGFLKALSFFFSARNFLRISVSLTVEVKPSFLNSSVVLWTGLQRGVLGDLGPFSYLLG